MSWCHLDFCLLHLASGSRSYVQFAAAHISMLILETDNAIKRADGVDVIYPRQVEQLDMHLLGNIPMHFQQIRPGTLSDGVIQDQGASITRGGYPKLTADEQEALKTIYGQTTFSSSRMSFQTLLQAILNSDNARRIAVEKL